MLKCNWKKRRRRTIEEVDIEGTEECLLGGGVGVGGGGGGGVMGVSSSSSPQF